MTRAKLLWFNAAKGHGYVRTENDERLYVAASAFAAGEVPTGRCAGVDVLVEPHDDQAVRLVFVAEQHPPRARLRRGGGMRSL